MNTTFFKILSKKDNNARLDLFIDWCDFLAEHSDEAIETLKQENLVEESMELYKDEKSFYIKCTSVIKEGCDAKSSNQSIAMNRLHKKLWQQIQKEMCESDTGESLVLDRVLYKLSVE